MRLVTILLLGVVCVLVIVGLLWLNRRVAPLCFDSRIERLWEKNLPKIMVERGGMVSCRMKADDFRFPLPPGTRATNLLVTGGFDTVDGSVEARFDSTNQVTAHEYETSLSGKIQDGGQVKAQSIPGGLLISFHYFGDK
jgi:hypothetical protein